MKSLTKEEYDFITDKILEGIGDFETLYTKKLCVKNKYLQFYPKNRLV